MTRKKVSGVESQFANDGRNTKIFSVKTKRTKYRQETR